MNSMEKRRSPRELLRAPGCIVVEGVEYPCVIHDRSVTGAGLKEGRPKDQVVDGMRAWSAFGPR